MKIVVNILGLKLGWWACVLGTIYGFWWIGPIVVGIHLAAHLALTADLRRETVFLVYAAVLGLILDSTLSWFSILSYREPLGVAWLSPIWMVVLWPNFASGFTRSLAFLKGRLGVAALFGAIGGPLAYWGGAKLGAITFADSMGLLWVSLVWAVAMPLLSAIAPFDEGQNAANDQTEQAAA